MATEAPAPLVRSDGQVPELHTPCNNSSHHAFVAHGICARAIILSILFALARAVNFSQCFDDIRNGLHGPHGGTDDNGNPVDNISDAVGITFALCESACGTAAEPFQWFVFSGQFTAWLMPSLALLSQLPFGAGDRVENLTLLLLAVGSPTLAAYSLALTVLNNRWLTQRFSHISYPNVRHVIRIMDSLQQAALKINNHSGLLCSLVVLPENDGWWRELAMWLDFPHTWSIAAATSVVWVLLAYLFTVIGAFMGHSPDPAGQSGSSDGQSIGTVWLWLLPVVIGWLQISPKCDSQRLDAAMMRVNSIAYVATNGEPKPVDSEERAFEIHDPSDDTTHSDEKCTAPIFNYARLLPWSRSVEAVAVVFDQASRYARAHMCVDRSSKWIGEADHSQINPGNREGNLEQVIYYCTPPSEPRSQWAPGVWSRMFIASLFAFTLQWGTAGAAIIIVWYTPTIGLGGRSGTFLVYAGASTLVWMSLVTSSILTHYLSTTTPRTLSTDQQLHLRSFIRLTAIFYRRIGKLLATCNAIWIVVACTLQFGQFYDRCYCNSSATGLKGGAFDVMLVTASDMIRPWAGGVALGCGSAVLFVAFIGVFLDPKSSA